MKLLIGFLALMILLPGTSPAQSVPDGSWPGVTLLLADGWRYREVTVYLDAQRAGLWVLRADGAELLVNPDRVTQIVAADGTDITDRVLSGQAGPGAPVMLQAGPADEPAGSPPERWDGSRQPEPPADIAPPPIPFKLAFTVEGGYGWPVGDWFWDDEPSWSAGARLRIGTAKNSYLGFSGRHQEFATVSTFDVEFEHHARIYDVTFGYMSQPAANGTMGYLEMGVGLMQYRYGIPEDAGTTWRTESSGAFVMRGGVMLPLNQTVAFDLSASMALRGMIFAPEDEEGSAILALHAGLTWRN